MEICEKQNKEFVMCDTPKISTFRDCVCLIKIQVTGKSLEIQKKKKPPVT